MHSPAARAACLLQMMKSPVLSLLSSFVLFFFFFSFFFFLLAKFSSEALKGLWLYWRVGVLEKGGQETPLETMGVSKPRGSFLSFFPPTRVGQTIGARFILYVRADVRTYDVCIPVFQGAITSPV